MKLKERGRTLLRPLNENKALKSTIRSCATTNFLLAAAPQTTPYFTHGTLRFCIPTMGVRYQRLRLLPVTSSGYTRQRDYILDKRRNIAYVYRMKNDIKTTADEFSADDLNLISLAQEYSDEDKARELLERLRWPNGPVCPHCKNDGKSKPISKLTRKASSKSAVRKGVYFCGACRQQFTVTVKTVFEGSHIPISKWLMAMFLISSSKKGMSAHQLHRMLKVTYKTAWFMAHRIRFCVWR